METLAIHSIWKVIKEVDENLGENITVDDMARTAMFSKFHFTRLFRKVIGVSPGRFLSAMRLQRAKHLLVTTSLNVTDISHRVGYASVSTFSSRFASNVGVSPTAYRRVGGYTPQVHMFESTNQRRGHLGSIAGEISITGTRSNPGLIFVGLFPDLGRAGRPARCALLTAPGPYVIHSVPDGTWHVVAHCLGYDTPSEGIAAADRHRSVPTTRFDAPVLIGERRSVSLRHGTALEDVEVRLQPAETVDSAVRDLVLPGSACQGLGGQARAALLPPLTDQAGTHRTNYAA